jgi:hypothetical protein
MVKVNYKRNRKNYLVTTVEDFLKARFTDLHLDIQYGDDKQLETKTVKLFVDSSFFVSWTWTYSLETSLLAQGILAEAEIINLIRDSFYEDLVSKYPPSITF